jgi:hypothetical protein
MGGSVTASVLSYVKQHGGGTIAVASQSNAASAILDGDANVAGIGGFSGRESDVNASWLAQEVRAGKIRWVLDEESATGSGGAGALNRAGGFGGAGMPGDTRVGARKAMAAVAKACEAVTLSSEDGSSSEASRASGPSAGGSGGSGGGARLYDCAGRAAALESANTQQSRS